MSHQDPIAEHLHEFSEIALILSGTGVHVTQGYRHELQAGDVLVITQRRAHGYEDTRDLNLVNILFQENLLPRIRRELGDLPGYRALFGKRQKGASGYVSRLRLAPAEMAQVEDWINRLEAELHEPQQGGYLLAEAYLTLIFGALCRRYGAGPTSSRRRSRSAPSLGRVLTWLEKNLAEPLRVADLAAQAGMSERGFHRVFRACLGASPAAYILRLRLQRAAQRLREAPEPGTPRPRIGEIAQQCGFEDSNYFTRAFRAQYGRSPREWRRGQGPES
jgi:AraC family L-rhamnose operon transcriptional activator RhaR/AraC family L-rhamnose operon regulatory protein RhaS